MLKSKIEIQCVMAKILIQTHPSIKSFESKDWVMNPPEGQGPVRDRAPVFPSLINYTVWGEPRYNGTSGKSSRLACAGRSPFTRTCRTETQLTLLL
jgi:hypothetical protein